MAKSDTAPDKVRVSLDLTESAYKRLGEIEQMTHAESKAGVIRSALQVYEYVVNRSAQGCEFISINPDGKEEHLLFFSPFATALEVPSEQRRPRERPVHA
jgi:hypothetical protein